MKVPIIHGFAYQGCCTERPINFEMNAADRISCVTKSMKPEKGSNEWPRNVTLPVLEKPAKALRSSEKSLPNFSGNVPAHLLNSLADQATSTCTPEGTQTQYVSAARESVGYEIQMVNEFFPPEPRLICPARVIWCIHCR